MEILFATNNQFKINEIRKLLGSRFILLGLADLNISEEIPEDYKTIEENALQKARYIFKRYGRTCIADDTGLEVDALGGEPGVFSARYSRVGDIMYEDLEITEGNIKKLLKKLENIAYRNAQFRTIIALILKGREYQFEGLIKGKIAHYPIGKKGFGYDPVFIPDGYNQTFAQMDLSLKNRISHRALAVKKFTDFLIQCNKRGENP